MRSRYNEIIIKCDRGYESNGEQENEELEDHFEFCARCGARLHKDGKGNLVCTVCNIDGQHEDPFRDLFARDEQ